MFPEALMLHYLDDLDSKMEAMRAHFEREAGLEGPWTSYNASLGRPLLDARKFEQAEKASPAKAAPSEETESAEAPATAAAPEQPDAPATTIDLFSAQKV